jgi:Tfp pilus assembly protein PilX
MFDFKLKNRGVALFVVLVTIFVVIILANIALNLMISQSRFTHHKVIRIQAEYAAWAAINYANEMLRLRTTNPLLGWDSSSCPALTGGCPLADANFPASITAVNIILAASNTPDCPSPPAPLDVTCISAQVQYAGPNP